MVVILRQIFYTRLRPLGLRFFVAGTLGVLEVDLGESQGSGVALRVVRVLFTVGIVLLFLFIFLFLL